MEVCLQADEKRDGLAGRGQRLLLKHMKHSRTQRVRIVSYTPEKVCEQEHEHSSGLQPKGQLQRWPNLHRKCLRAQRDQRFGMNGKVRKQFQAIALGD